jgi:hypothetical protein
MEIEIKKRNIEYIHRNIWINRGHDNNLSNLYTDFHLKPLPMKLNVWGNAFAEVTPPQLQRLKNETRQQKQRCYIK